MTTNNLTPAEIVASLDAFIVGQNKAKRAVAIALRSRFRRQQLDSDLRDEISPKNIIMIGPTGVGKTEIARRLSKLTGAPFIKVEATKFTEVGYVGRDVESMIRDLMSVGHSMVKAEMQEDVRAEALKRVEDLLLDLLLPGIPAAPAGQTESASRDLYRTRLHNGELEDKHVEIMVNQAVSSPIEIFSGAGFDAMDINLGNLGAMFGGKKKKRRVTVREARQIMLAEESEKMLDMDKVAEEAKQRVEQMGIVFIDEIDKIASKDGRGSGPDVSREGVQRDILPIVEGSKVNTKHGIVDTTHILFIAAGAFHMSKPSDLIPELQGRFPIRVELEPLTRADLVRILTQPKNSLTRQYTELLGTEGVTLEFTPEAVEHLAKIAEDVNNRTENIGARRLHTILERLLEDVSFHADTLQGQKIVVTPHYVDEKLGDVIGNQDLGRYIL